MLLRLRRNLGFGADGPIHCQDDVVEVERDGRLRCDVWDIVAGGDPARLGHAAEFLLSEQFRYDDRIEDYRQQLRRRAQSATR